MKFCFVLELFFEEVKGGSEIQAYLTSQELIKRGWEVHYIRENNKSLGKVEKSDQIHLYSMRQRHSKLKWMNIFRLFSLMKKIKADFWYCRGTISYLFPVWLCSRFLGGKVIWACSHDTQVSTFKKGEEKRNIFYNLFFLFDKKLFLHALRRIDLILLQSQFQNKLLRDNLNLKGEVIYNGHPIPEFKSTSKEQLVLWIGRLQNWKHPERFIEIVEALKDKEYQFSLLGNSSNNKKYLDLFKTKERELPKFKYLGELERREVFDLLSRAKLVINTSDSEGFSNTFIEAWFHGVPVLSLHVDPDKLIEKYQLGMVSQSLERSVNNVEQFLEDDMLFSKVSNRCRDFSVKNFDIKEKVDSLERLLR